jgi:large subunit ribosomal protein L29
MTRRESLNKSTRKDLEMAYDIRAARKRDTESLSKELSELQRHMFDLRTQGVTEKLEDPSQVTKTRRNIARLKTLLRERELAEQNAQK